MGSMTAKKHDVELTGRASQEKLNEFRRVQKRLEKNIIVPSPWEQKTYNTVINYPSELNPSQCLAATTINGPLMIIAGAGSGKTRTLTYRMAYLLESGIAPEKILLLTFTRKASAEMVQRSKALLGEKFRAEKVIGSTFHSYANLILRKYGNIIGIDRKFSIMDASDSADALDLCAKELELRNKGSLFPKKAFCQKVVSSARNWDVPVTTALQWESLPVYEDFHDEFSALDKAYEKFKKDKFLYDFDDLMLIFRDGLKNNSDFRSLVQGLSEYVMVDEFQDTNVVQKDIVDLLVAKHRNLMVVGDDAQSIYAFRGANVENVFKMVETYPDAKVVKIEQNYRSVGPILDFANSVTDNALMGFKKTLFTELQSSDKPLLATCFDADREGSFIVRNIRSLISKGISPGEIAVIARSAYHTNNIQLGLIQNGIDFVVMGGIRFIERKHVKDLLAHLKIMDNVFDEVAWHRVLEMLPSIGKSTASKVVNEINKNQGKIDFSAFSGMKAFPWLNMLEKLLHMRNDKDIATLTQLAIDHYMYIYESTTKEGNPINKRRDLESLIKIAEKKSSLKKFLNDLTLDPPDKQGKDGDIEPEGKGKVVVSTVHSSKGLEFEYVFIPHLLDGLFPSDKSIGDMASEEEERRVFYVACTRAKKRLVLSHPKSHQAQKKELKTLSRFVVEAKDEHIERVEV